MLYHKHMMEQLTLVGIQRDVLLLPRCIAVMFTSVKTHPQLKLLSHINSKATSVCYDMANNILFYDILEL